jgi:hypothetical protein
MTNTSTADDKKQVPLFLRIALGSAASAASGFILTWCSLHGVDFKTFGISSEVVKSTIEGTLTGIFVAPECIPLAVAGFIYGILLSGRTIMGGFTKPLPLEQKE